MFEEKAEVVKHLDTCDSTEDLSAMILLSVIKKLIIIFTTSQDFQSKDWSDWTYKGIKTEEFPMCLCYMVEI